MICLFFSAIKFALLSLLKIGEIMQKSFPLPTRQSWGLLLVPIAVGMVSAIGISLNRPPGSLSHIFLFLLIVIAAATWWGLLLAVYASVLSLLAINFFFFQPYGSVWFTADESTVTSEILGLVFFAILAFVLTYLTLALRRERDRARLLAESEREAKEAVVRASLHLERQHRRVLYLQRARHLLGDTFEPESVLPKVLDELVENLGGKVFLLVENYNHQHQAKSKVASQTELISAIPFWQSGYEGVVSASAANFNAADLVIALRTGSQHFGRIAYTFASFKASDPISVEENREITTSLSDLAECIAISLENGQLYRTLEFQNNEMAQLLRSSLHADTALTKRAEQLSIFYRLSAVILSGLNRTDLMLLGLSEAARVLNCQVGAVLLYSPNNESNELELVAHRGELGMVEGSRISLSQGLPGYVVNKATPFVSNSFNNEPQPCPILGQARLAVRSCIYVPMMSADEPLGVIAVGTFEANQYGAEDLDFLQGLAGLLTMALVSQRYYFERERAASVEERNRIARDLHDGLAQSINYIGLKMQLIQELYADGEYTAIIKEVARVAKVAEVSRSDIREALYGLRHTESDRTLLQNLTDLVHGVSNLSGINLQLTHSDSSGWPSLSLTVQIQLLRIIQEALSNIQKHSKASEASVNVKWLADTETLKITIKDNGVGFDAENAAADTKGQHLGLSIMRERAARIGTTLDLKTHSENGTLICLEYRSKIEGSKSVS